jgi:YVTN family beta-propeller protein
LDPAHGDKLVNFRILGELEAVDGDRRLELGGAKQRAVLAILILHRGEAVSTDRLIDDLWGERPPPTAAKTVQVYISHLRKVLGEGVVSTRGRGYMLAVDADQIDAGRFEQLATLGRESLRDGDPTAAAAQLREALELWRGSALADFAYEQFARTESARLEEGRLDALEDRIDADLALGEQARLCGELEALVDRNPLRERLQGQLMLALYRSGRQAEALDRYAAARASLHEGLGIAPGRRLQELQRQILDQDPALDPPSRRSALAQATGHPGLRRGAIVAIVGGVLLLGAVIGAIVSSGGGDEGVDVAANSVAVIDLGSGEITQDAPVGARPSAIAAGEGALWVANIDDGSVSKVDPAAAAVEGNTVPGGQIDGLGAGAGGVWVADVHRGVVAKIDPDFRRVVDRVRISPGPIISRAVGPVAVGAGSVWVGDGNAAVARIDPRTLRVSGRINVGNNPTAVAVGDADVWVADDVDNTVSRIDAASEAVTATIPVGAGPAAIAVGEGGVWVAESQVNQVVRIDPATGAVTDTIEVGERPTGIVAGEGGVWVANSLSNTISRIDPGSREVDLTVDLGQSPQRLAITDGRLWVTANEPPAPPEVAGDREDATARIVTSQDASDVDPASFFSDTQRAYATCARLFNYPDQPAPSGSTLEPEVAAAEPDVSADGRTYTFTIRSGFRFSPPSGAAVTAAAFEREIERVLSPPLHSYGAAIIQDIVGAKAVAAGRADDVSGVRADGDRLTIRLLAPAPDFLARISTPWFCAVPPDTPTTPTGASVIPTAGPYYVESYEPKQSIVLRRNPNYGGDRPAELDEIDYALGVPPPRAVEQVASGAADLYTNNVLGNSFTPEDLESLDARFGPQSEAARAGDQRLFVTPQLGVYYLLFNTNRPPFDDPRVRQAANFAIDREALARVPFPDATARPTDQFLPPGVPGFSDQAIYPLGRPDVERARELAGPLDARAVLYVCNLPACAEFGQIVRADLAKIGIAVAVREFAIPDLFKRIATPGEPFDLAQFNYFADYPDPFDFVNFQFQSGIGINSTLFSDPALDAKMADAAALSGDQRYDAYAKLDRELSDEAAPGVPLASGTAVSLFSPRIGCQVAQPIYGIDLGRLCVR